MSGRLQGKTAVITGAYGGIGQVIAARYLQEKALVVLTGRNPDKLKQLQHQLRMDFPESSDDIHIVVMDNSAPSSVADATTEIIKKVGMVDVLINNAGSAGPKSTLANLAQHTNQESEENLQDAIASLLSGAWLVTNSLKPYFNSGASIINVSTIFSQTEYYGRAAYAVPKAALNCLSKQMAIEFGSDPRCIRVNTVLPGPVASERIENVFSAMDKLRSAPAGTTSKEITDKMIMHHARNNSSLYVSKEQIADTMVFLGSNESTAFTAHDFAVSHGLTTSPATSMELVEYPDLRSVVFMLHKYGCVNVEYICQPAIYGERICLIRMKYNS